MVTVLTDLIHVHRYVEIVSTGKGHRPKALLLKGNQRDRGDITNALGLGRGCVTVCPHGTVLREGWPNLAHDLTGQALVQFATEWKQYMKLQESSLPAHCLECAA